MKTDINAKIGSYTKLCLQNKILASKLQHLKQQKTSVFAPLILKKWIDISAEAPGGGGARGGKGGRPPPNVLQDHFSNSPNSGVKIAGGGGKTDDLGNYNVYEHRIYNLATSVAFSHNLYGIDSNFFLVAKPPGFRSMYAPRLHISSA